MQIELSRKSFFIFDLDDTLMHEIEFLQSAYKSISAGLLPYSGHDIYEEMLERYFRKENVFEWVVEKYGSIVPGLTTQSLLKEYRTHFPDIQLKNGTYAFLQLLKELSIPTGLITDGRSITQRNKLRALGIDNYFDDIIISEEFGSSKPNPLNYLFFTHKYPGRNFYFIGDNTSKDFTIPLQLGWVTICIRDTGKNIHPQSFSNIGTDYYITSLEELEVILIDLPDCEIV